MTKPIYWQVRREARLRTGQVEHRVARWEVRLPVWRGVELGVTGTVSRVVGQVKRSSSFKVLQKRCVSKRMRE